MENLKNQGAKLGFATLLCVTLLPSCGSAVEGEAGEGEPGQVAENEFSINTCATRTPDAVILRPGERGGGGESWSPTKYGVSGCEKSWVVDLTPNSAPIQEMNRVEWGDPWPRNRTQCETATLKLTLIASGPGLLPSGWGSVEAPLVWDSEHQECLYTWINVYHVPFGGAQQPEQWVLDSWREGPSAVIIGPNAGPVQLSSRNIGNYNGLKLRLVASALAPHGGSTQPLHIWSSH